VCLLFWFPPSSSRCYFFYTLFIDNSIYHLWFQVLTNTAVAISNQDLYELVQDAHNGAILFSTLKQAVQPLIRQLETNYSTVIKSYRMNKLPWIVATGAIAAVAIFCFWNPAGWAAAGAYGAGGVVGGAAGSVGHSKWDAEGGKAFGKKDRVRECKVSSQFMCPPSAIG
jgi:hypothetical protein